MSKGPKYFFKLWGRNLKGHVAFFERAIKSDPVKGYALLALGILPVLVLSPFTSLIKTVVDYVSRKPVPKAHQKALSDLPGLVDAMKPEANRSEIEGLLAHITSYNPRTKFSTMSNSTQQLLRTLENVKPKAQEQEKLNVRTRDTAERVYCTLGLRAVKDYMADGKNVDKGMYRHIAAGFAASQNAFFGNLIAANEPGSFRRAPESVELELAAGSGEVASYDEGYDSSPDLP